MNFFLMIMLCVIASIIALQDFKYRAVTWVLFPGLAITGCLLSIRNPEYNYQEFLFNVSLNCLFVLIQISLLWLIYRFASRPQESLTKKIGLGDILFFFASAFFFSFEHYVMFYVISLICTLAIVIVFGKLVKKISTIPLAGLQALFLLTVKILEYGKVRY